jgi:hypothetical protein
LQWKKWRHQKDPKGFQRYEPESACKRNQTTRPTTNDHSPNLPQSTLGALWPLLTLLLAKASFGVHFAKNTAQTPELNQNHRPQPQLEKVNQQAKSNVCKVMVGLM